MLLTIWSMSTFLGPVITMVALNTFSEYSQELRKKTLLRSPETKLDCQAGAGASGMASAAALWETPYAAEV